MDKFNEQLQKQMDVATKQYQEAIIIGRRHALLQAAATIYASCVVTHEQAVDRAIGFLHAIESREK